MPLGVGSGPVKGLAREVSSAVTALDLLAGPEQPQVAALRTPQCLRLRHT